MRLRLCWADKIPLGVFAAITVFVLFLGTGPAPPDIHVTREQYWAAFADVEWILFYKVILGPWIILRIIDLCMGGPSRRVGRAPSRNFGDGWRGPVPH